MTRRIAFLVYPQFQLLDTTGPLAAFELANREQPGAYALEIIAVKPGSVASSAGVALEARALPRPGRLDTLVVAGGEGTRAAVRDPVLLAFLRECTAREIRVTSVCSGSFILAAAGVLDGRAATTHWSRTREFRAAFPRVRLEADRIYVHDGPFWTSAGITAGIDLALALIAEDLGEAIARRTAQQLVVYYRRPGGQSQFSPLLELERGEGRFTALLDHVRQHLALPHDVDSLAGHSAMSPRHFARRFKAEVGVSPARAVERIRVDAARARLARAGESVQAVAVACGFGNAERMRRSFVRLLGVAPAAVRREARR